MSTKVIYIAGTGRSGSTFLSQLLSQNNDCFNVGQIRDLPNSFGKNLGCSCYSTLEDCEFWAPVVTKLKAIYGPDALDQYRDGYKKFRINSDEISTWDNPETRAELSKSNSKFLNFVSDIYRIASEQADGATLVDSSKAPNIALALILAKDISVTIVHLMRDPRAVLASWAKLNDRHKPLKRRCHMWNNRAAQMDLLKSIPEQNVIHVKYEDFASAPKSTIADIQKLAGVQQNTSYFNSDVSAILSWDRTHLFPPANDEVLGKHLEQIDIRPSETWKSPENKRFVRMARNNNFPLAKRYGYK